MHKKIALTVSLALLSVPLFAFAQSTGGYESQLLALLQQLQKLEAEIASLEGGGGTTSTNCTPGTVIGEAPLSGSAPLTVRFTVANGLSVVWTTLNFGDGTNIAASALTWNGELSCVVHTYTAPGTYTVTNNYGGSITTIATITVSGNSQTTSLSASPTSGPLPLTVTFSGTAIGSYTLNYGDNTGAHLTCDPPAGSTCGPLTVSQTHTYTAAGTYMATLSDSSQNPQSVTITVTGTSPSTTFTASPNSGAPPLAVSFNETAPSGAPFYSAINFGDGTSGTMNIAPVCATCAQTASISHTYPSAGTYPATLRDSSGNTIATAQITVTSTNTSGFSATPTSGSLPLTVAFSGVGTGISFGDGTGESISGGSTIGTVSHTYTSAGTYQATSGSSSVTITAGSTSCTTALPTHDLTLGDTDQDTGGDVTLLQEFLVGQGTTIYPGQLVTGFFGHATQSAVKRFQQKWNIEQTGFVGPLTRAAMKSACSGGSPTTTNTFSFSASPTSGSSPLAVTFTANQAETLSSDLSYVVDFGDGNRGTMSATSSGAFTLSHTYTTGGTFNPILYQERNFCGGVATYGCVADLAMASTSVTVNGGSNNPLTGGSCTTSEFLSGPGSKYGATSTPGFYVPATFANPGSNSITIEFMNYPGTGQSGTAASQSLVQGWGSPMTKTYPAGTVLYGDPDWWDGLPNTGVPPSVNCALDVQFDPCVIYQCVDGTWTTHQIVPARGVQPSF